MRYCVIKDSANVIDGSNNNSEVMLNNAINAGFSENEVEILAEEEYKKRAAIKTLEQVKQEKVIELSETCQQKIIYGFVASDGYGYRLTIEDQLNMQGQKNELEDDETITSVNWMTIEDIEVTLTKDEWLTVYKEAFQHKNENIWKNKQKRDEVNASATIEEVESIVW